MRHYSLVALATCGNWALDFDDDFAAAGAAGWSLPVGYTLCEYIESTGSQYIDTGIKVSSSNSVLLDIMFMQGGTYGHFGARTDVKNNAFNLFAIATTLRFDVSNSHKSVVVEDLFYRRMAITFEQPTPKIDGEATPIYTDDFVQTEYNSYLFTVNTAGVPTFPGYAKLYGCTISRGLKKIAMFIPCLNGSGVAGLYDVVGKKFHENKGTGNFDYEIAL